MLFFSLFLSFLVVSLPAARYVYARLIFFLLIYEILNEKKEDFATKKMLAAKLFSSSSARRVILTSCSRRAFGTRMTSGLDRLSPDIVRALPTVEEAPPEVSDDPAAIVRGPVTSTHMIDIVTKQVSTLDSAAVSPTGSIVHGRYGDLGDAAAAIPLEFLALLRPAAEGAAALRTLTQKSSASMGTLLMYGASLPGGLAAAQMASAAGHAVVAVVGSEHAGDEAMMEVIKGLIQEPGTAVPESYALSKKNFADLVTSISTGDEGIPTASPATFLEDFKANFVAYSEAYPDTRPAAVDPELMEFKYMEKDRETWDN